mgnify:CR=1 FL=1
MRDRECRSTAPPEQYCLQQLVRPALVVSVLMGWLVSVVVVVHLWMGVVCMCVGWFVGLLVS